MRGFVALAIGLMVSMPAAAREHEEGDELLPAEVLEMIKDVCRGARQELAAARLSDDESALVSAQRARDECGNGIRADWKGRQEKEHARAAAEEKKRQQQVARAAEEARHQEELERVIREQRQQAEAAAKAVYDLVATKPANYRLAWSAYICQQRNERADALATIAQERRGARYGGTVDLRLLHDAQNAILSAEQEEREARAVLKTFKWKEFRTPLPCRSAAVQRVVLCLSGGECDGADPDTRLVKSLLGRQPESVRYGDDPDRVRVNPQIGIGVIQ